MDELRTDYKDDVLDTSVNEKRRYNLIQNEDGTVSLEDVTTYLQTGDSFGAKDINETNKKVNDTNNNLTNENGEQFRFAYQDGKRGMWVKEADTDVFVPFKNTTLLRTKAVTTYSSSSTTFDFSDVVGFEKLSVDNFGYFPSYSVCGQHTYAGGWAGNIFKDFTPSYNSDTGIFTLSWTRQSGGSAYSETFPAGAYIK